MNLLKGFCAFVTGCALGLGFIHMICFYIPTFSPPYQFDIAIIMFWIGILGYYLCERLD